MNKIQDKVVGSWFGLAVGDAMGSAARGLKPETIKQCFKQMDGFKDVRPFLGKGVKHYKMQGLYGAQTQMALVICDTYLKNRNLKLEEIVTRFLQLSRGGVESYFGVYRHPEGCFRKTVESIPNRAQTFMAELSASNGTYLTAAVPVALFNHGNFETARNQCLEVCLLLNRNFWELTGVALTGYLINRCLTMEFPAEEDQIPAALENLLQGSADFCEETEAYLKKRYTHLPNPAQEQNPQAVSIAMRALESKWKNQSIDSLKNWICENAAVYAKTPISHAAQGYVLTLLPLALVMALKSGPGFAPIMTASLNMGGEADKLGALVGAFAGAIYGFSSIPPMWVSGLVNSREIKARGEALLLKRLPAGLKDLYEMEAGLSLKEYEARKKHLHKEPKKTPVKIPDPELDWTENGNDDEIAELLLARKNDPGQWRKYEKDKSRKKRDRRKKPGGSGFGDSDGF